MSNSDNLTIQQQFRHFLLWVAIFILIGTLFELFEAYRLSHDVKIADMLIAATALVYDVKLLSKNQKDFRFIDDLKLIKYAPE